MKNSGEIQKALDLRCSVREQSCLASGLEGVKAAIGYTSKVV